MNKIEEINNDIKLIEPKLTISARDWNKGEKEAIAHAYNEITKLSTPGGKGRHLDTGCSSCVNNAVVIITNYLAAIGTPVVPKVAKPTKLKEKMVVPNDNLNKSNANDDAEGKAGINDDDHLFAPTDKGWRKNHDSITAAAKELEYTFAENEVTKQDRITALEKHITTINAE